eukprot:GHVS01071464.1.p1 GENE.GHVS01071464.1~~GHVS01071464.1.p1  ORF type:complete len:355 (-),score=59.73 GHVS01071464.1:1139-2203(-)
MLLLESPTTITGYYYSRYGVHVLVGVVFPLEQFPHCCCFKSSVVSSPPHSVSSDSPHLAVSLTSTLDNADHESGSDDRGTEVPSSSSPLLVAAPTRRRGSSLETTPPIEMRSSFTNWQQTRVPYLIACSDLIRSVGSGMTVKFFPLFFKNDLGFLPDQLCLLFLIYAICIGLFMTIAELIARRTGRGLASFLYSLGGVVLLFWMCVEKRVWVLLLVFVLRGALQNANYPIDRSLIMDYTKNTDRGKWNAVESFTSMTWSGSAVIGGVLADSHDYRYAFRLTGFVYLVALLVYFPVILIQHDDCVGGGRVVVVCEYTTTHTSSSNITDDYEEDADLLVVGDVNRYHQLSPSRREQ